MTSLERGFCPETGLVTGTGSHGRRRRAVTLPLSIVAHGAGLAAVVIVPLLSADALPDSVVARAFFVEPMTAPAPPPPPPPPAAAPAVAARPEAPSPATTEARFVAPVELPSEIRPEEGLNLGVPGGVPGGVEGGVPGGVIGGIVGGLPGAALPAPALAPVRVGGLVKEPEKVRHVDPVYPKVAIEARVQGIVIIEAVIDAVGRVKDAKILRGVPILDEAALAAVREWLYTPTLLDGVPTPVVMTVTVTFRLKTPSA